ncbi:hypothetical protein ES705_17438 [subsurface metagenome]
MIDKQQAQKIIRNTFENPFDISSFTGFIKNLLNRIDEAPFIYQGNYIPDAYKQYIKKLERIGKFGDGENNIDILVITLQKETSLERARTMQRNFIAWYLNGSRGGAMKDAALAAFVSPDEADWRFSLVKMDYKFEQTKTGKMKVKEEFTSARRWSFLVGANEKSHTAQSRLVNILANDEQAPVLEEIENAFDIETVTKEFFLKYRELFIRTKEELDRVINNDPRIKTDFEAKGVDTVNFAKKLLGQIVFLYFLQKKGWFGVGRDNDWGTGSKHFLRELFDKKHGGYNNFFNDVLEPLFYEALRSGKDREHIDYYYSRFNCKIPFLNGGLFDPIGHYDWVHTDIIIADSLFSNDVKTKEGDIGDGILDIFDRFNFTVKEDEPLEKEVAIDPELLGKAYEKFNAIRPDNFEEYKKALKSGKKGDESKFNKQFGVYYTPREIVHYMCQQSLVNYLYSELNKGPVSYQKLGNPQLNMLGNKGKKGQLDLTIEHKSTPSISKEDIETLIHIGEHVSENEEIALIKEQSIKEGKQKTSDYKLKLPESVRSNAALIDQKLTDITVCDPAVGSGAFPVGMMSEIVRTRNVLSTFIQDHSRTLYEFKRCCIEHSLYGVDIDPGAVEIAKLRLWLSLVVDEDDIKNIKPLPNLDYRIMQGNSLISEFMGINFDTEKEKNAEELMFKDGTDEVIELFQQKKDEFLNTSNVSLKTQLKDEVDDLLIEIFETKLKTQKANYFNRLKKIEKKYSVLPNKKQRDEYIKQDKETLYKEFGFDLKSVENQLKEFTSGRKIKPFFLWNLYFSEVFHNKGGFDIVIANPPYGASSSESEKKYLKKRYEHIVERIRNSFLYFLGLSHELLRAKGIISYIIPNEFLFQIYMTKARTYFLNHSKFIYAFNIGENVFEAIVPVCLIAIKKDVIGNYQIPVADFRSMTLNELDNRLQTGIFDTTSKNMVLHTVNSVFSFNLRNTRLVNKLIETCQSFSSFCDAVSNGICTSCDDVYIVKKNFAEENGFETLFVKPCIRGGQFTRYFCPSDTRDRVLYITKSFDSQKGKAILKYLNKYRDLLVRKSVEKKKGNRPWHILFRARDKTLFQVPKIMFRQTGDSIIACIDEKTNYYGINSVNIAILKSEFVDRRYFLLGLLNAKLTTFIYREISQEGGRVLAEVKPQRIRALPIVFPETEKQEPIEELVKSIVEITSNEDYLQTPRKQTEIKELEKQIDQMVYKLYGLTDEEITIVEGINE